MQPELAFSLFGMSFTLKAYVLFALSGALAGIATALPLLKREGLPIRRALVLLLAMAAAFLIGARLFNYAINPRALCIFIPCGWSGCPYTAASLAPYARSCFIQVWPMSRPCACWMLWCCPRGLPLRLPASAAT